MRSKFRISPPRAPGQDLGGKSEPWFVFLGPARGQDSAKLSVKRSQFRTAERVRLGEAATTLGPPEDHPRTPRPRRRRRAGADRETGTGPVASAGAWPGQPPAASRRTANQAAPDY